MPGTILHDIRFGLRLFARAPGVTIIAVLTLAVGTGGTVALFSVVNAVLLRSLPFRDPGRLVFIYETQPDVPRFPASYPDYQDWRAQNKSFQQMAGYSLWDYKEPTVVHNGEADQVVAALVSDNLFSVMGIEPVLGRGFVETDEHEGRNQVVILSHRLWEQWYSSDPNIVGKNVEINGKIFTVIGVASGVNQFPSEADIWLPVSQLGQNVLKSRHSRRLWVIGRLKRGVIEKQAFTELKSIAEGLSQTYPEADRNVGVVQVSLLDYYVGNVRTLLMILLGAAALVLLIACANVANILLARAASRKKEIAIRAAHGASRGRVFGQLLTESLLLSIAGASGGLLIAYITTLLLRRWAAVAATVPRLDVTGIDPTVLGFAVGVAVLTGLLFGTLPAIQASRTNLADTLKQSGRGTRQSMQGGLRNLLIAAEVALAFTILIGTGLLVKSLTRLLSVNPGFRTDHLLTLQLSLPTSKYSDDDRTQIFYRELLERVTALPGVKGTATINVLQLVPSMSLMHVGFKGAAPRRLSECPVVQTRAVSEDYFALMDIPMKRGADFQESRLSDGQRGVIINESMSRMCFGDQNPIGKELLEVESPTPSAVTIIGVAADTNDLGLDKSPEPEMYYRWFSNNSILLVNTTANPMALASAVREQVKSIDPYQPIGQVRTMQDVVDESLSKRKVLASLMGLFSMLSLILSAVGIYGVVSYSVVQRTSEIGIRIALGASRGNIIRLLLSQEMIPVMFGTAIGFLAILSMKKLLSGFLYKVSWTDPLTLVTVVALIVLTALVSTLVPARRATEIDPMTALRRE